ncbi:potassium channel family protein [Sulfurovum sp.]|uniref:potassium channel family protein n=1 Tax=Sulfurovum sp. TaxID=1969726 RepID=UPI0035672DEC
MQDFIFHSKPKMYASVYLLLIPLFGLIYYLLPETIGEGKTLVQCFYFSAVTITTLGYGDISPTNDLGRLVAASESIFGITLIGLFLNALSRVRSETTRSEEIEKEKNTYREGEIAKLNGFYSLIRPLAEKYKQSVIQITSPLKSRTQEYNHDFTLNDMMDLYKSSMLLTQNQHEPAVKYYFSSLNALNTEISDLIKNVDLRLFPKLEKHCLSFVNAVHSFDFSDSILGAVNTRLGNKKMTDYVSEMLEKHSGEVKFLESNMINGYAALYHQIKLQMKLLELINEDINTIVNS